MTAEDHTAYLAALIRETLTRVRGKEPSHELIDIELMLLSDTDFLSSVSGLIDRVGVEEAKAMLIELAGEVTREELSAAAETLRDIDRL